MNNLFHRDLHKWVKDINLGTVTLDWSLHAREQAQSRSIPTIWSIGLTKVIECEKNDQGEYTKLLIRKSCPGKVGLDICIVVRPLSVGEWRVVTVWLNRSSDKHITLDRSKYAAA